MVSIEKLENFIVHTQEDLELIKGDLNAFNIFNVLGIQHREIRHSNFLGWLFDPNESHQMDDLFLKELLKLIRNTKKSDHTEVIDGKDFVNLLLQDLISTSVYRESVHNIDILIVNEKLGFLVCIENKINANFSDHQLEKYYSYVEKNYSGIPNRIYLTLTPLRNNNHLFYEAGENYANISYADIITIIKSKKELIQQTLPTIKESIHQYIAMTEKSILNSSDEVKLAQRIYKKYRNELDFIFKHRIDFTSEKLNLIEFIIKDGLGDFEIVKNEAHPKIIRLLPKDNALKTIFKDERFNSWGGDYIFCIELFLEKTHIWIKLCFGDIRNKKNLELQEKKTEMVQTMKEFKCFKNIDLYKTEATDSFVGICGQNILFLDEYIDQENDFFEYFKMKFEEVNQSLIQRWIKECVETYTSKKINTNN